MASMTAEQIKDEFIGILNDNYGYWTGLENSQETIPYLNGAFDLMERCIDKLDRTGEVVKVDECGEK